MGGSERGINRLPQLHDKDGAGVIDPDGEKLKQGDTDQYNFYELLLNSRFWGIFKA